VPADSIGWIWYDEPHYLVPDTVDVDGARAFERDSIEFLVLEHHVLAILALIAFDLVFVIDRLAGLGIDIAGMDAVARRAVKRVEAHLLGLGSGRQHRHRTSHERQLQISSPGRSRRHGKSPSRTTNRLPVFAVPDHAPPVWASHARRSNLASATPGLSLF
jgi:hypothetical protein